MIFISSFIHSFIPSFLHSFIHSFILSFFNSFILSFFLSFMHLFIYLSIDYLTIYRFAYSSFMWILYPAKSTGSGAPDFTSRGPWSSPEVRRWESLADRRRRACLDRQGCPVADYDHFLHRKKMDRSWTWHEPFVTQKDERKAKSTTISQVAATTFLHLWLFDVDNWVNHLKWM